MDLREMKYIIEISKYGSLSETSRSLFIPQPTLSNAVKRIEKELNQPLFIRTADGMEPTQCGRRFIELASRLVDMHENVYSEMNRLRENANRLGIGVGYGLGEGLPRYALANVQKAFPNRVIELAIGDNSQLMDMVKEGRLDYAVVVHPKTTNGFGTELLCEDRLLLAVPPNHLDNEKYAQADAPDGLPYYPISRLANKEFILPEKGHSIRDFVDYHFQRYGIAYYVCVICSSAPITRSFVSEGVAFGFIPRSYMQNDSKGGPKYYLVKEMASTLPVTIIFRTDKPSDERMLLVRILKEILQLWNNK